MPKFRKKLVVIDAFQWLGTHTHSMQTIPHLQKQGCKCRASGDNLRIETLEGIHLVTPRDWIIKGVKGEFYPCKPDIFDATYERVK